MTRNRPRIATTRCLALILAAALLIPLTSTAMASTGETTEPSAAASSPAIFTAVPVSESPVSEANGSPTQDPSIPETAAPTEPSRDATPVEPSDATINETSPLTAPETAVTPKPADSPTLLSDDESPDVVGPDDETPVDSPYTGVDDPPGITFYDGISRPSSNANPYAGGAESPTVKGVVVPPRLPGEKAAGVYLNNKWTSEASIGFTFGRATDGFLAGDWDGNGSDTLAIRDGATYYVTNRHGDGAVASTFAYGRAEDEIFVGDWDGNGTDTLALRRGNTFYIQNTLGSGSAARTIQYGRENDVILVGDWNGDGTDTFAVRRGNTYYVRNSLTSGPANVQFDYGRANDHILVGDWDGNGTDTLAVRRGNTYLVRNSLKSGVADTTLTYGRASDEVVVGDWNGDGSDTLGVVRCDGVVPSAQAGNSPRANYEGLWANKDGTITAAGWAFDPDRKGAVVVQLHVDNQPQLIKASLQRTDVKNAFGLSYDTIGFVKNLSVKPGRHTVCATAINEGAGSNTFLWCASVDAKVTSPDPVDPSRTFVAGNIIADSVMFNSGTMTAAQVQSFFTSQNPNCQPGSAACLKDYRATTASMTAPYCNPYVGAANESAATMLYKSAKACGINPQVLIVMLQKEQGLITASGSSLTELRYSKALGFGCPDFAGCKPEYAGLAQQFYYASSQLIRYGEEPDRFNFRVGQTANIQYHPDVSCGSSPVYLQNRATAALYNYTPYQPNAAALKNMAGEGDACSAYGNRNFWRLFNIWFGSTH